MGVLKDFDCSTVKNTTTVQSGNVHATVSSGVAYTGRCNNKSCAAYKQTVVCNRGLGSFTVNDDIAMGLVKCPACGACFDMHHVCLYRCKARVTVLDHQEEVTEYAPTGDEVVQIGSKTPGQLTLNPKALLQIDTLKPKEKCVLM
eukprot:TRINITY_DN10421_c1_g2_i1.p1 TRINITY_DN10421_c1_g2~~TRINITY_DN10421_c1_g2_i1.p1  ORF type:complete len:145 (+),score=54.33 TRINITY_DN10421_c1_g2_i1:164-598(+)